MVFNVELEKLRFSGGRISAKETIGSWNTGGSGGFSLRPGKSLGNMAAKTKYRIVTVIVSALNLPVLPLISAVFVLYSFYYFISVSGISHLFTIFFLFVTFIRLQQYFVMN